MSTPLHSGGSSEVLVSDSWVLVFCCDCGELLGVRDHIRIRAEHFEREGHRGQRYVRAASVAEGAEALTWEWEANSAGERTPGR